MRTLDPIRDVISKYWNRNKSHVFNSVLNQLDDLGPMVEDKITDSLVYGSRVVNILSILENHIPIEGMCHIVMKYKETFPSHPHGLNALRSYLPGGMNFRSPSDNIHDEMAARLKLPTRFRYFTNSSNFDSLEDLKIQSEYVNAFGFDANIHGIILYFENEVDMILSKIKLPSA